MEMLDNMDQIGAFGLLLRDERASGRVWRSAGGYPIISYRLTGQDMARAQEAMVHAAEMCLAAGAKRMCPVVIGASPVEGARGLNALRKAKFAVKDVVWTSYHPLGTCRMGRDPKTSVVDLDHQAHGAPGLFVVDASTVRGPLGVNPQITIMAMANRAAERIAERLGAGATRSLATG
jgi:hypothetical protein